MAELGGSIEKLASPDVVFKPFSVLFIARQAYQLLVTHDASSDVMKAVTARQLRPRRHRNKELTESLLNANITECARFSPRHASQESNAPGEKFLRRAFFDTRDTT